jgi:acetyltransferase-like isoleucine patch superfamily enzyme
VGSHFRFAGPGRFEIGQPGRALRFGVSNYGFLDGSERSLIRNYGTIRAGGQLVVAAGNHWDVLDGATLDVGDGTYFSPHGVIVASTTITIGTGCAIGWNVQFLDDDFHDYEVGGDVRSRRLPITIGDRVWIGSHSLVFKGVSIAAGCVVAAGSVVVRSIDEPDCLVAGSPAQIVNRNVRWG